MEGSLGLVFQYFFTIGVGVGFGLLVGAGLPVVIFLKIRRKTWNFSNRNNRTSR